jgi:nitrite reductase/ring-hydroxylating ferredoxin subunit/uncharacterized membrane protein
MTLHVTEAAVTVVAEQSWLDPPARALQHAVQGVYEAGGPVGRKIKNFWHGVWLGHPLHPVITDVPVGAWTAALVLDTLDVTTHRRGLGAAADVGIGVGVLSALAAAIAGLTDWQHVNGKARRIGLVHGLSNVAATGLFGASWVMRGRNRRATGRQLSLLGYLVAMVGAYLGGHLVFAQRIGVKHTPDEAGPDQFTPVLPVAELADGRLRKAEVRGVPLLLVRRGDRIHAMVETCSHLGGPLSEGWLVEDSVVCPWHQSRYRLEDGQVLDGPSTYDQPCFETRVRNGQVEVRAAAHERQTS